MSVVETLAVLYGAVMKIDPAGSGLARADYFVLSKGHAGPALTARWRSGIFPRGGTEHLNQNGTRLPNHPDRLKTRGVDAATSSGWAGDFHCRRDGAIAQAGGATEPVFCIVGDGEAERGTVLGKPSSLLPIIACFNLTVFVDWNKQQLDGEAGRDHFARLHGKFRAFGFDVMTVKGR